MPIRGAATAQSAMMIVFQGVSQTLRCYQGNRDTGNEMEGGEGGGVKKKGKDYVYAQRVV